MKKKMLLRMERSLRILVKRKNNLQFELDEIDNLPLTKVNEITGRRWHIVFCKIKHLEDRIENLKTEMEILAGKRDKIKDIISESKSVFNYILSKSGVK